MTNSQAAAHESWLVRCSPRALGFSCEQSASITLILQKSANATCTQPCDPPTLSVLHASFVAIGENIADFSGNRTRAFSVGPREYSSLQRHNHHATYQCYVINFTDIFIPPPQSRTDLGHTPLSSHCTRHFS